VHVVKELQTAAMPSTGRRTMYSVEAHTLLKSAHTRSVVAVGLKSANCCVGHVRAAVQEALGASGVASNDPEGQGLQVRFSPTTVSRKPEKEEQFE
jgi:hypothetical protein